MTSITHTDPLMLSVSGCRGIVGTSLTPATIVQFVGALSAFIRPRVPAKRKPQVVIAHDGRAGGEHLCRLAFTTLIACGCDVRVLGVAMTPTVGVCVDYFNADAGLQITASHNPQQWNGLKPMVRAVGARKGQISASAPSKGIANQIIALFHENQNTFQKWDGFGQVLGDESDAEMHQTVVINLLKDLGAVSAIKKRRFSVALDTVAGSGRVWGAPFLEALGVRVHELYPAAKHGAGLFPHTPEPLAENLKALTSATKKVKAAAGFAQDPDADRLAIVDERGRYIGEEYTLVLACRAMAELGQIRKGSLLATNLSTSRMIDDVAAQYGAQVLRTAVGEANVVDAMKTHGCVLGGEGNGGVIWPKVTYIRDSLSAMGLVLALCAKTSKTISQLVAEAPSYAIVKRKVELSDLSVAKDAVQRLAEAHKEQQIDRQDGIRIDWPSDRAWLHVRASNTEPIMRLIAEAPTTQQSNAILDAAARVIG